MEALITAYSCNHDEDLGFAFVVREKEADSRRVRSALTWRAAKSNWSTCQFSALPQ